jgi:PKD repeat protein
VSGTNSTYTGDEYSVTVAWGDGTQDVANVDGGGVFTVTDPNGITTQTVTDTVSVADAALNPGTQSRLEVTQNIAANGATMAQFTDGNSSETPSAFTASINWGDGNTTAGVVSGGGGVYSVSGSHTYSTLEPITATITVTDAGGSQVVITTPVTTDMPPSLSDVADFTDTNTNDTSSQFTALIAWGDNSSSYGTVLGGNGMFSVMASHTYAEDGAYPMTTTISGPGGPLVLQSTAQVGDPPLSASQPPQPPPQAPPPAAAAPTIQFSVVNPANGKNLTPAVLNGEKGGVRVHIDDAFYSTVPNPGPNLGQYLLPDYALPSVRTEDPFLVAGSITISAPPAGTNSELSWNIPTGVRLWWKPQANGEYQLASRINRFNILPMANQFRF